MAKNKKRKKDTRGQEIADRKKREQIYFSKLKDAMGVLGSDEAFELLDEGNKQDLCYVQSLPVKMKFSSGLELGSKLEKMWNTIFVRNQRDKTFELCGKQVSIYDLWMYFEPLYNFITNTSAEDFPNFEKFNKLLPALTSDYSELRNKIFNGQLEIMDFTVYQLSTFMPGIIYHEWKEQIIETECGPRFKLWFEIYLRRYEKVQIDMGNCRRTAYKLAIRSNSGQIIDLQVSAEDLGLEHVAQNTQINIYIQEHAFNRFYDRINLVMNPLEYMSFIMAFAHPEITVLKKDKYLLAYKILGVKVGYFLATYADGKFVVRTFLFLTNSGTPEGDRLTEILHIEKHDKEYLKIDNLQMFLSSDIGENERLKKCFIEAGCGGLFEVEVGYNPGKEHIECAEYIVKYLNLKEDSEKECTLSE